MEVRLVGLCCTFMLFFAVTSARNVNSKPDAFENTYGDLFVDAENKDIQNDDYDNYDITEVDEDVSTTNKTIAEFITKPQNFTARIGEVVRLPCEITNPDVVSVWRKDNWLLYQGNIAIEILPNMRNTGEGLEINVTSNRDYGQYVCQMFMSLTNTPKIIHTIVPPTSPVITSIRTLNNKTVFNVGDTLELTCIATGHPQPKVSWYKDNERIEPSGENITILNLEPHNAGVYRCLADNGIKPLAHSYIEINIEHKPQVGFVGSYKHSNTEKSAVLKCIVSGYPPPVVNWQKDGINIKPDPPRIVLITNLTSMAYTLVIENLTDAEFGEYACSATNKFGTVESRMSIGKAPLVRGFVKPKKTNKDVVLIWKVQSNGPIKNHQVQYRKKGEEEFKNIKPEVSYDREDDIYMVNYTLKGLEPGSYETRARFQNIHGWSNYSDIMPFEGVNSEPEPFEDTCENSIDAENKIGATPKFITKPQVFIASIGEIVWLPCEITNPNVAIVWWKDESELLYHGDLAMKTFPNIKKISEGLEINVTSNRDYGQYTCQMMISFTYLPEITHTIVPPAPPVITSIRTLNNKTVFNVGDTLELTCVATGRPQPKVSWHKNSERIEPSGENITILNLKPHNAGIYSCLADNGIKPLAHSHIEINIGHKPNVTIEKYLINSNKEKEAQIKCIVSGYPSPMVIWQKDGSNIKPNHPKILLMRNQNSTLNILLIKNLTDTELGEYTCSATNKFGKVEKAVSIGTIPVVQGFVKPEKTKKDVLNWKVQSKAPITEHQILYRKKGEEKWKSIKPEVEEKYIYMVKYTLKGLEPGSYETRVRSENDHGWSIFSDIMPFRREKQGVSNTPAPRQEK